MEYEDSRFALFSEPNAYIQHFDKPHDCNKEIKKVVFQQPYESLPAFYIDNNLKKGNCDCSTKQNEEKSCNHDDTYKQHHNDKCHNNNSSQNGFGFDIKSLLPLIGLFNKGGGADLSNLVGMLNNTNNAQNQNASNPMSLISSILSNPNAMSGILNMFKGGGLNLFNKKQTPHKELKSTDFEIKNYTRVE